MTKSSERIVTDTGFRLDTFVPKLACWQCHSQSIEYGNNVYQFLTDRSSDGHQVPCGGEQHTNDAQRHAAHGTLKGDSSHPAADMDEFVNLG